MKWQESKSEVKADGAPEGEGESEERVAEAFADLEENHLPGSKWRGVLA